MACNRNTATAKRPWPNTAVLSPCSHQDLHCSTGRLTARSLLSSQHNFKLLAAEFKTPACPRAPSAPAARPLQSWASRLPPGREMEVMELAYAQGRADATAWAEQATQAGKECKATERHEEENCHAVEQPLAVPWEQE